MLVIKRSHFFQLKNDINKKMHDHICVSELCYVEYLFLIVKMVWLLGVINDSIL